MPSVIEVGEYLRAKMIAVAEQEQCLTHPQVVAVSEQLDRFIVQMHKQKLARKELQEPVAIGDLSGYGFKESRDVLPTASASSRSVFASSFAFRASLQDPYPIA